MPAKYKRFEGRRYRLLSKPSGKLRAQQSARTNREKGYLARVVSSKNLFVVYVFKFHKKQKELR